MKIKTLMKIKVYDVNSFGFKADGTPTGCQAELSFSPVSGNQDPEYELLITKKLADNKRELWKVIAWAEKQITLRSRPRNQQENEKALTATPATVNAI